jgi:tol-pal system protein YbgF
MIAMTAKRLGFALVTAAGLLGVAGPVLSQSQPQAPAGAAPGAQKAKPVAAQPAAKTAAKATDDGRGGDATAQLRQRIDQLEEQINEMHVAVGTLDSFAKSSAGRASSSPAGGGGGGGLSGDANARLDGLDGRLRQVTAQIEQLAQQMKALEGGRGRIQDRTDAAPLPPGGPTEMRQADMPSETPERSLERADAIGGLIRGPGNDRSADVGSAPLPPIASGAPPRQQPASLTTGNPREVYEKAYGSLLRQDYAAAEIGFAEFLTQFPSHELSGNAQYWLGESFYVRGQYRPAANAFLKGYQSYAKSQKAPDSLLKLGMSLEKLGQRDAACSSIGELATRFPTAPAHIQSRAQSERARLGC